MDLPSPPPPSRPDRPRVLLNAVLFVLTVLSTIFVGTTQGLGFLLAGRPAAAAPKGFGEALRAEPRALGLGLVYAAVLLAILLAHELAHYLACRRHGLAATLPFFIPAPTLIGTMGAFIRIKSPITRRRSLFDIGAAGPLAGFALALPAAAVGIALSKVAPALAAGDALSFGEPLLLKALVRLFHPALAPGSDVLLHPVAFAGWVGLLVTAFNLFPLGQLDGGHVAYALAGRRAAPLSKALLAVFAVLGLLFWAGWWVWGLLILALGLRHPRVQDESEPLSPLRRALGWVLAAIFVLAFTPEPVKGYAGIALVRRFVL